jgi:hypothetical protein
MKTLLTFTALSALFFCSCRKNYACECTNAEGDTYTEVLQAKMKEAKAQEQCDLTEWLYGEMEYQCVAKEI